MEYWISKIELHQSITPYMFLLIAKQFHYSGVGCILVFIV